MNKDVTNRPSDQGFDYTTATASKLFNRLARHTTYFAGSMVLTRIGQFLLFPLYWRYIRPEEYGILGLTELVYWIGTPLMTFALDSALTRFYHEWPDGEREKNVGVLWSTFLLNALAWWAIIRVFGSWLWPQIIHQIPFSPYIDIALVSTLGQSFHLMLTMLWRIQERVFLFVTANLLTFVMNAGLTIYFVVVREWGILGILYGTMITYIIWAAVTTAVFTLQFSVRFSWTRLRASLRFSLPIVPASLLMYTSRIFDRFFLDKYTDLKQIGYYSLGNQFGNVVGMALTSVKNAWIPSALRIGIERSDAPIVIARLGKILVASIFLLSLALAMFSKEFILLSNREQYVGVYDYVPLFVLIHFLYTFQILSTTGLLIEKVTRYDWSLALFEVVLAVGCITWAAPALGAMGIAMSIMGARCVSFSLRFWISQRIYPVPYDYKSIGSFMAPGLGIFLIGFFLPDMPLWASASIKAGMWGILALVTLRLVLRSR